ncbi:hypothetical protein [Roseomonas sp. 18066]|uniref:hypothetical protein n=1 Tax=Roseomonas sp. 18066 TaxID=2681412 RepID=UPI001357DA61|nr:hypothetical protein [Roseomonas sp. 18066]
MRVLTIGPLPPRRLPAAAAAAPPSGAILWLAWLVELLAVGAGCLLALHAWQEGEALHEAPLLLLLPFTALAAAELAKIPLIALAFRLASPFAVLLAGLAVLAVAAVTFENFAFGLNAGFAARERAVAEAEAHLARREAALPLVEARLPPLEFAQLHQAGLLAAHDRLAEAIRAATDQAMAQLRLTGLRPMLLAERQRLAEAAAALRPRQEAELAAERRRCVKQEQTVCRAGEMMKSQALQAEALAAEQRDAEQRIEAEADRLQQGLAALRQERDAALAAAAPAGAAARAALLALGTQLRDSRLALLQAAGEASAARLALDAARDRSQVRQIAETLFQDTTPARLEGVRIALVAALAGAVALTGPLLASLHYAAPPPIGARGAPLRQAWLRLLRARRRYYLRRARAAVPPPPQVVEVPKEIPVDRVKLVFLPAEYPETDLIKVRGDHQ